MRRLRTRAGATNCPALTLFRISDADGPGDFDWEALKLGLTNTFGVHAGAVSSLGPWTVLPPGDWSEPAIGDARAAPIRAARSL
jgi:hypothetical protein